MWLFLIKQSLKRIPHYYLPSLPLFFSLLFLLVISPFSSSGDAALPACGGAGGGRSRRGRWGRGKTPRQGISTARKVAQDSKWMRSENHLVLEVRGRAPCSLLPGKVSQFGGFLRAFQRARAGAKHSPLPQNRTPLLRHIPLLGQVHPDTWGLAGSARWALPLPPSGDAPRIPPFTSTVPPAPSGDTAATWETRSCLSQMADE